MHACLCFTSMCPGALISRPLSPMTAHALIFSCLPCPHRLVCSGAVPPGGHAPPGIQGCQPRQLQHHLCGWDAASPLAVNLSRLYASELCFVCDFVFHAEAGSTKWWIVHLHTRYLICRMVARFHVVVVEWHLGYSNSDQMAHDIVLIGCESAFHACLVVIQNTNPITPTEQRHFPGRQQFRYAKPTTLLATLICATSSRLHEDVHTNASDVQMLGLMCRFLRV